MDISVTIEGAVARLEMGGRFDFSLHRAFKEAYDPVLGKNGIQRLEIDMGRVEYLDSSARSACCCYYANVHRLWG